MTDHRPAPAPVVSPLQPFGRSCLSAAAQPRLEVVAAGGDHVVAQAPDLLDRQSRRRDGVRRGVPDVPGLVLDRRDAVAGANVNAAAECPWWTIC
ncbi:hypothetical protein [Streptomyces sp. NPDC004014]